MTVWQYFKYKMKCQGGWWPVAAAVVSAIASSQQQQAAQKKAREDANTQRGWERDQASMVHQTEVADLKAAGLNPNLSAGGGGNPVGSGSKAETITPPAINLPDFMSYEISQKQLAQADARLKMDQANSAAGIAKTLSETEINKMRKILAQKGLVRAEAEGEASGILKQFMQYIKKSYNQNKPDAEAGKDYNIEYGPGLAPKP